MLLMAQVEMEMIYLTTHSTHFIYGYMASDIWLRTILIVRKETRGRHIVYSFRLTARVRLYAPSYRQDSTNHGVWYTSRGALAGTRNSLAHGSNILQSMGVGGEGVAEGCGMEEGNVLFNDTLDISILHDGVVPIELFLVPASAPQLV